MKIFKHRKWKSRHIISALFNMVLVRPSFDICSQAGADFPSSAYHHMYPPNRVCTTPDCPRFHSSNTVKMLTEPVTHKATLFTLREGSLPIYTTSFYCRGGFFQLHPDVRLRKYALGCNRRYHHNYSVHNKSGSRDYYGGVPQYIQVAKHFFMDAPLLEFFANCKVFGW